MDFYGKLLILEGFYQFLWKKKYINVIVFHMENIAYQQVGPFKKSYWKYFVSQCYSVIWINLKVLYPFWP